jgi:hypothetical protein
MLVTRGCGKPGMRKWQIKNTDPLLDRKSKFMFLDQFYSVVNITSTI